MRSRRAPVVSSVVAAIAVLALSAAAPGAVAAPISLWTFNAANGADSVDGNNADLIGAGVSFPPGPLGLYADFNGSNQGIIRIPHNANLKPAAAITLEAWVRPVNIHTNRYYEIYRKEDGNDRHLFSFQEYGTVLSLGLSTGGGYKELDAPILPAMFEDGQWHHVAATYDSAAARAVVYYDGAPWVIGLWSGAIGTSGTAPSYIGSSGGGSEFFHGGIDDMAVHSNAFSPSDVAARYATVFPPAVPTRQTWNLHDDWNPTTGFPDDDPRRAWFFQRRLATGAYEDLLNWGRHSWWTGGNAWRNVGSGNYPVVGPRIGNFDHQEPTVDAYIAANGLASMDLIQMHPGSSNDDTAVVTWRSPLPGSHIFRFDGIFWHIDNTGSNGVDVSISASQTLGIADILLPSALTGLPADTLTLNAANPGLPDFGRFSFSLRVAYGDEVHFRVNARGDYGSDATMLGLQVTWVPEPATLAILLGGLAVLARSRRTPT